MNILLVEPNYKNKYPPMGLMKISTYHKSRGDKVYFIKGNMDEKEFKDKKIDRVYITTLFSFYYNITIKTIKHYEKIISPKNIYVGGIFASIITDRLKSDIDSNVLVGQLTNSNMIGFDDNINVDICPLDYSILEDIEYKYQAGDNYLSYTTRGCPNKCKFCAVPILEPNYKVTNNIKEQILKVNENYGEKRNLLLLDNNIFALSEKELQDVVDDMMSLGFIRDTPTFIKPTPLDIFLLRYKNENCNKVVVDNAINYLCEIKNKIKHNNLLNNYKLLLIKLLSSDDKEFYLIENEQKFKDVINKYSYKRKLQRYVDFNQGLEAARMTKSKMKILSKLPLSPVRIAFDHYNPKYVENYIKAVKLSASFQLKNFSNYMLYNFNDRPEDLWSRIKINIDLAKELGIHMFSFPMKYVPVVDTDRKYIGKHWNRKYLQAIPAILLVTKGIVADGESFFNRAFGKDLDEYFKILTMPKDFITYRSFYENQGLTQQWEKHYKKLSESERKKLVELLSNNEFDDKFKDILKFYGKEYYYSFKRRKNK